MFELLENGQVLKIEYIGKSTQKTAFCNIGEQNELFESGRITEEAKNAIEELISA